MPTKAPDIQKHRFHRVGSVIERDADELTRRWTKQAIRERPDHFASQIEQMSGDLPGYLRELGRHLSSGMIEFPTLAENPEAEDPACAFRSGWTLDEVMHHYQILRELLIRHLAEVLDDPLSTEEMVSLNGALDQALSRSIRVYLQTAAAHSGGLIDTMDEQIIRRTRQLKNLGRSLIVAEQRERRRVARLLHEHFQQLLFAVRMKLQRLQSGISAESRITVVEVDDLVAEAIRDARTLTTSLSPPALSDSGLIAALKSLADAMQERYQLDVEFEVGEEAEPEDAEITEFLFQAVRELLLNVVKHSGKQEARVGIHRIGERLIRIAVEDSGEGMPVDPETHRAPLGGFGLADIRQRIRVLGGELHIEDRPGGGTTVTLDVPSDPFGPVEETTHPGVSPTTDEDEAIRHNGPPL